MGDANTNNPPKLSFFQKGYNPKKRSRINSEPAPEQEALTNNDIGGVPTTLSTDNTGSSSFNNRATRVGAGRMPSAAGT